MSLLQSLLDARREPAECIIKIDGAEIAPLYPFLTELTVEAARSEASVATMRFETRRNETGEWVVQDAKLLRTWAQVVIEAAFGSVVEEVLHGFIREINTDYPEDGGASVTVICQDDSIALDREHRRRVWGGDVATSDAEIVREILGRHGLTGDAASGAGQSGLTVNQDETDAAFLHRRADANGYELIFGSESVYFGPWRVDSQPQANIMVYAGPASNCISFSTGDDGHQPDAVGYDCAASVGAGVDSATVGPDLPAMGPEPANSASAGLGEFLWRMSREGGGDAAATAAAALKKANELSMKIKARGVLDGSLYGHVLRVAEPVGVDGVGTWLGGIYYVDAVTHKFDQTGYRQEFTLLRNAYGDNLSDGGSALSAVL